MASNLVDVIKTQYSLLAVDAPPCLSEPAVRFWLNQKFNPSDELLGMQKLANSKTSRVRISQNAKLVWDSDTLWDKAKYKKAMEKFFKNKRTCMDEETSASTATSIPTATAYVYRTRKRVRVPGWMP